MAAVAVVQLALFLSCSGAAEWALGLDSDDHHARGGPARARAELLATLGFAQWLMHHPDETCPASIDDVSRYVDADTRDPWGTRMEMICRPDGGFGVQSAGPDGSFHTADDVHSSDPEPDGQR